MTGNRRRLGYRVLVAVFLLLLGVYLSVAFAQKINLHSADLGRHIQNGRLISNGNYSILYENTYSYTQPHFEVVNHHWGSGVVFYWLYKAVGFEGLSVFYMGLSVLTVLVFVLAGCFLSPAPVVFFSTFLTLPLITFRTEIRPEGFSYFFLGLFFLLLTLYRQGRLSFFPLLLLTVFIQLCWVNSHIFFVFGLFLTGLFFLNEWFGEKNGSRALRFLILGIALFAVCFFNPNTWKGVLEPFLIFQDFGYMLAENQSVFFMQKRNFSPVYAHLEVLATGLILLIIFLILRQRQHFRAFLIPVSLIVIFGGLAFSGIRLISLFGFLLIPSLSVLFMLLFSDFIRHQSRFAAAFFLWFSIAALFLAITVKGSYYSPFKPARGVGLTSGAVNAASFFRAFNLQGPVFNNYDNGGYLIFFLYPRERVFVDNRPEAYGADFFKDRYIPMQQDEAVWAKELAKTGFNSIFFYRHDMTPWAQPFLIRRLRDPEWAPVYVDGYSLILLRRNELNREIIRQFELPMEIFRITGEEK